METGGSPAVSVRKPLTAKAIIHQKFGTNACYKVEEVQEPTQDRFPGLAIPQKGRCLYRCSLQLPDFSVMSETFSKKKDAEQSAAQMALDKLHIHPATTNPTAQEAWDDLVSRVTVLFSNEFLSSSHPLSGHFRAAFRRDGDLYGSVPASVIAVCDSKLTTLCKLINPKVESNPFLVILYIRKAARKTLGSVVTSEGQLSLRRQDPYPPEIIESTEIQQLDSPKNIWIEVIHIPCSLEKAVQAMTLSVPSTGYYLDIIAQRLGLTDANKVLVSRTIGKASSETRLYFAGPKSYQLDISSDLSNAEVVNFEGPLNARASYFCCQDIYGDAILASIGYKWNCKDLCHENITLQSYYRMLISKTPSGSYKLSRSAILAAELPFAFTTRTNWRGSFPKEILCVFCRQHRLSEPVFSTSSFPLKTSCELSSSRKELEVSESAEHGAEYTNEGDASAGKQESVGLGSTFRCEVKIYSKSQDLIIECSPKDFCKKQIDSIQNAAVKVLSWLNAYLKDVNMPLEELNYSADILGIQFQPQNFFKALALCPPIHNVLDSQTQGGKLPESNSVNMLCTMPELGVCSLNIEGPDSGVCPSNGSLLCISYNVSLVTEGECMKELLESSEEFEFEIGTGAVIPHLEVVVTQMSVGQSASFNTELPPQELILAASDDSARTLSVLLSKTCCLEYSIIMLRVTDPPEDRMEQALFKPPLSKQRVEYAVQHIKESCATTLVDFGCGSGSLLDSLLDYPTALEKIVGVDISQKGLIRAAKMLHSRLSMKSDADMPCTDIKSAVLYDGSILVFDSRLRGFDIGTCLEVIEHMQEEQAYLFGEVVLGSFCPRMLIVSTPNYEYNVILQRSSLLNQEDDPDEKTQSESRKFRNHDHKFEWTREQFNHWASELATKHNYSVEFGGVGGSADQEPGFASQIAVFKRGYLPERDNPSGDEDLAHHYNAIWEWNGSIPSQSHMGVG